MNPIVQVAICVVAVALVVAAVALVRTLGRVAKAVDLATDSNGPIARLVADASETSAEVRQLVVKLETISEDVAGVTESWRHVGDRAASMSEAVLDQMEPPVERAVALVRGIRAGARVLAGKWVSGNSNSAPLNPGRVK